MITIFAHGQIASSFIFAPGTSNYSGLIQSSWTVGQSISQSFNQNLHLGFEQNFESSTRTIPFYFFGSVGEDGNEISFYPVPIVNHLNIRFKNPLTNPVELGLYTLNGRLILKKNLTEQNTLLNITTLRPSNYVLLMDGIGFTILKIE